jgi:beta-lactamase class A
MLTRRNFVALTACALPRILRAAPQRFSALPAALAQLEQTNGGRLGVSILDTATGERSGYRPAERFPMCSTFKFLLVAAIFQRVDQHHETLDRALAIPPKPMLFNSPLTEPHAGGVMPIADLCLAALTRSDNTAANVLLQSIGGPPAITAFARSIGDQVTRLDRTETALNESLANDPRDTTSPEAMANNLNSILLGNVLSPSSRNRLMQGMEASTTGIHRLRAQLPQDWRAVDKSGSNGEHTSNDIAVFWPLGKPPVIVTTYITQCPGPEDKRSAMMAEIGHMVFQSLG